MVFMFWHTNYEVKDLKKQDKARQPKSIAQQIVDDYVLQSSNDTDPLGSYTGKALNPDDVTTQDADDL